MGKSVFDVEAKMLQITPMPIIIPMSVDDTPSEGTIIISISQPISSVKDRIQRVMKEVIHPDVNFDENGLYFIEKRMFSLWAFLISIGLLLVLQFIVFPKMGVEDVAEELLIYLLAFYSIISLIVGFLIGRMRDTEDYLDWLDIETTDKETVLTLNLDAVKKATAYLIIKGMKKEFNDVEIVKM